MYFFIFCSLYCNMPKSIVDLCKRISTHFRGILKYQKLRFMTANWFFLIYKPQVHWTIYLLLNQKENSRPEKKWKRKKGKKEISNFAKTKMEKKRKLVKNIVAQCWTIDVCRLKYKRQGWIIDFFFHLG